MVTSLSFLFSSPTCSPISPPPLPPPPPAPPPPPPPPPPASPPPPPTPLPLHPPPPRVLPARALINYPQCHTMQPCWTDIDLHVNSRPYPPIITIVTSTCVFLYLYAVQVLRGGTSFLLSCLMPTHSTHTAKGAHGWDPVCLQRSL